MDAWGMSHETLQTDPEHSTGSVRVLIHGGEPHYEIVTDCVYDFIARELLEEKTPRRLSENMILERVAPDGFQKNFKLS
jgi:hypothetical protein